MEGPAGPGLIEAPAGLTPLELRAAEDARRSIVEHLGKNPVLKIDELIEITDLRPRLEKEMRLPGDSRGGGNKVWFFSVDGTLSGNHLKSCLLAGECIMVQAKGFEQALKLAKDGLHDTIELAREYFDELQRSIVVASPLDHSHMSIDVGGRLAGPGDQPLKGDPKLRAMIEHIIGGKPWKP